MLRNRSLLNGLGLGLVVGALLLQLMNSLPSLDREFPSNAGSAANADDASATNAADNTVTNAGNTVAGADSKPLSIEKLKQQAAQNGYQLYTQAELDAVIQQKLSEQAAKQPPPQQTNPSPQQAEAAPSGQPQTESAPQAPSQPQPPDAPAPQANKIAVYLSGGLNAAEIAYALHRSGVIADADEFQQLLIKQKLTGKIRAGYYEFDGPQTTDQVIAQITAAK